MNKTSIDVSISKKRSISSVMNETKSSHAQSSSALVKIVSQSELNSSDELTFNSTVNVYILMTIFLHDYFITFHRSVDIFLFSLIHNLPTVFPIIDYH